MEGQGIDELYDRCKVLFEYGVEVIFVNNGSLDNTATKLTALPKNDNLKIISLEENEGYGGGIIAGLNASVGKYVGWTHADLQTNQRFRNCN